jgi:hypothetical protein
MTVVPVISRNYAKLNELMVILRPRRYSNVDWFKLNSDTKYKVILREG